MSAVKVDETEGNSHDRASRLRDCRLGAGGPSFLSYSPGELSVNDVLCVDIMTIYYNLRDDRLPSLRLEVSPRAHSRDN